MPGTGMMLNNMLGEEDINPNGFHAWPTNTRMCSMMSPTLIIEPEGRLVKPNTRPGLGISINEAAVAEHPFEQELPQRVFYSDGSVGDW